MKQRLIGIALAAAGILFWPLQVLAQDEGPPPDARLEGYAQGINVKLDPAGSAVTWIIMLVLAGTCVAVMFKNANRSHLD